MDPLRQDPILGQADPGGLQKVIYWLIRILRQFETLLGSNFKQFRVKLTQN